MKFCYRELCDRKFSVSYITVKNPKSLGTRKQATSLQNQQNDSGPSEDSDAQADQMSSKCAQWVAKDPSFLHADSEGCDQTGKMPRLI